MAATTRTAPPKGAAPESPLRVDLYDDVSRWSVRSIVETLRAAPNASVQLRINCPGGAVTEGFALANALRAHAGKKIAIIEGACCSAATFAACACDETHMYPESFLMVHAPSSDYHGVAEDLDLEADLLRKMTDLMAGLYRRKSGKDDETVRQWMSKNTWMTPTDAKAAGLCDLVITDSPPTAARARTARYVALLKPPVRAPNGPPKNKRNTPMEEKFRDKLAKYGLDDDDGNIQEALAAYMAESEDSPAERKEMAKAVEEMKESKAKAEDDDDKKEDEDKGEKAMSRVTSAMALKLAEADSERKALAKQVAALEKERADREVGEVIADAKSRGLTEADAKEFYKDFGKAGAMRWLAKFPRKVSALGKWNLGGGELPAEGSAVEKVQGINVIGRGLAKAARELLAKGEAKNLGEAQILAAKRYPHLYQTSES